MYINKHYIPYGTPVAFDFMHETFIYGIDFQRKYVYLADFFDGKYQQINCDFFHFENAYLNSFEDNAYFQSDIYFKYPHMTKYNMNKIVLIKTCNSRPYFCDKKIIISKLYDYIEAKNSFGRVTESYIADRYTFYYGIEFYNQLILDLRNHNFDIRKPYVLLSHKLLFKKQLTLWSTFNFITSSKLKKLMAQIDDLINISTLLYRKYLKMLYSPQKSLNSIHILCNDYESFKTKDINFVKNCLTILEKSIL